MSARTDRVALAVAALLGALAIAALWSASACAVTSEWAIEGETFAELKLKEKSLLGTGGSTSISIPGWEATITCAEGELSGKFIEGGTDELTTSLHKCEVVKKTQCKVSEPVTVKAKSVLLETGGDYYDELEAASAGTLTTITITGKECTLPESSKLEGKVAADVSLEEAEEMPLTFSEAISKEVNEELEAEKEAKLSLTLGKQAVSVSGAFVPPAMVTPMQRIVRVARTKLCAVKEPMCPMESIYNTGTALALKNITKNKFVYKIGKTKFEPICVVSTLSGTSSAEVGAPLPGTLPTVSFQECGGGNCPVTPLETPWPVRFEVTGRGNGTMQLWRPTFKIVCGGQTCIYGAKMLTFSFEGGDPMFGPPPGLKSGPQALGKKNVNAECSEGATWEGVIEVGGFLNYEFTEPTTLYLSG